MAKRNQEEEEEKNKQTKHRYSMQYTTQLLFEGYDVILIRKKQLTSSLVTCDFQYNLNFIKYLTLLVITQNHLLAAKYH